MSLPAVDPIVAVILLVTVGTLALRGSFIFLFGRLDEIPPRAERTLRFVPAAVLAALVAQALVVPDGRVAIGFDNYHLIAGSIAAVVAWRTENMVATLAAGMLALWTLELLA